MTTSACVRGYIHMVEQQRQRMCAAFTVRFGGLGSLEGYHSTTLSYALYNGCHSYQQREGRSYMRKGFFFGVFFWRDDGKNMFCERQRAVLG